jgi:hypothetical protein
VNSFCTFAWNLSFPGTFPFNVTATAVHHAYFLFDIFIQIIWYTVWVPSFVCVPHWCFSYFAVMVSRL